MNLHLDSIHSRAYAFLKDVQGLLMACLVRAWVWSA